MVADKSRNSGAETADSLRGTLTALLRENGALSAAAIARLLSSSAEAVCAELRKLVEIGVAEVMQPVGIGAGLSPDLEYYRWKRRSDTDYVWQANLIRCHVEHRARLERRFAVLQTHR